MKIIMDDIQNEIIVNKSKFITYLYKIYNINTFYSYLENLKKEYHDATHICYAYIIDNQIKYYDDSEPTGTSGIPILEVLKKSNLNYIGAFVIRYYGGIKLGSSGLIRAYSNSISEALKKGIIIPFEKQIKIKIIINYEQVKTIENLFNQIIEKNFDEQVTYIIITNKEIINKLDDLNIPYKILNNNYFKE